MHTLQITHLRPGNHCHMQAVLEKLHFRDKGIKIIDIRFENGEKYIDYEVLEKEQQTNPL